MLASAPATSISTRPAYVCFQCRIRQQGWRRWKGSSAPNRYRVNEERRVGQSTRSNGKSNAETDEQLSNRESDASRFEQTSQTAPERKARQDVHHEQPSRTTTSIVRKHFAASRDPRLETTTPVIRKHSIGSPDPPLGSAYLGHETWPKPHTLEQGEQSQDGPTAPVKHRAHVVRHDAGEVPTNMPRNVHDKDRVPLSEFQATFAKHYHSQPTSVSDLVASSHTSRTQVRRAHPLSFRRSASTTAPSRLQEFENQPRIRRVFGNGGKEKVTNKTTNEDKNSKWKPPEPYGGIRSQLREWLEINGHCRLEADALEDEKSVNVPAGEQINNALRNSFPAAAILAQRQLAIETQAESVASYGVNASWDASGDTLGEDPYIFKPGDLVDIESNGASRASEAAVFVRRAGHLVQLLTVRGKWTHTEPRLIRFVIPQWMPAEKLQSIVKWMPKPETMPGGIEELRREAYMEDLSIPRSVSGDVVERLQQFTDNVNTIYRRHVQILDKAHTVLAHDTDIRHGSLKTVAAMLLRTNVSSLSGEQLCAVFRALRRGGYAFEMDRLSYRVTGQLQIRSKELVRSVELVRGWIRQWQVANQMDKKSARMAMASVPGAAYVSEFIQKARAIVLRSREDRGATQAGLGISRQRFPLEPGSKSVRSICGTEFNEHDREILRFLEHWSLGRIIDASPDFAAYPPMVVHATGLYDDWKLTQTEGLIFLQELGTVLPYESRIRFSPNLHLVNTGENRPLRLLQERTEAMELDPHFVDTMADLRHDWKDLPAYAIDSAGALEIDDAISIERGAVEDDGRQTYWIHVHVANPTAFFARDHAVAKLARHMGETVYFPEEPYRMLPEWVSRSHFSLGNDRPCLTFSTRVDDETVVIERMIRPGTIRHHVPLTYDEVDAALGDETTPNYATVLTVGGQPPMPSSPRVSSSLTPEQVSDLRLLNRLAVRRQQQRVSAGAVVFQTPHMSVQVWDSYDEFGVDLDEPYEQGSRRIEGDPVVSLKAERLKNWFAPQVLGASGTVAEMMMLAGETVARWCEERQIPALFRVTTEKPDSISPKQFYDQHLAPLLDSDVQEIPLHLGWQYVSTYGRVTLSTTPSKQSIMGVDRYCKVTSPLRRYGDMIQHWQIEAALRKEAELGNSLIHDPAGADRSFLPYSTAKLDTLGIDLQARERLIRRSTTQAHDFWTMHLLNRAKPSLPQRFHVCLYQVAEVIDIHVPVMSAIAVDLGIQVRMDWPQKHGLPIPRAGDVWEVEFEEILPILRYCLVKPLRLARRVGEDGWIGWVGNGDGLEDPELVA